MPTLPDDPRVQRSVASLREALLELLKTKRFDQIEIRDITDAAGVSYRTFLRRFASKDELLEEIAAAEVRNLLMLGEAAMGADEGGGVRDMCEYIQRHRNLWTVLLTGGAASAMREEFMRVAKAIAITRPRVNPWLPLELSVPFVTNGIFDIFAWWMGQPEDYPIENVVKLFSVLIVDSLGRPRNISLI
jgi:AcrR family transcriptional regulator